MNNHLTEAYRLIRLIPTDELLECRATVLTKLGVDIDIQQGLNLLRLYLGGEKQGSAYTLILRQAFRETDASFPINGNDLEMQVLAGLVMSEVLAKRDDDTSTALSLAIIAVFGVGWVIPPTYIRPSLLPLAYAYLARKGVDDRKINVVPQLKDAQSAITKALTTAKTLNLAVISETDIEASTKIDEEFQTLESQWEFLCTATTEHINILENKHKIFQEEAQMLWWLAEWKTNPVSPKNRTGSALLAGRSLGERTVFIPGPISARALLHEALCSDSKTIHSARRTTAVADTPHEWRQEWVGKMHDLLDFCPIASESALSIGTITAAERPRWFHNLPDNAISLPELAFQTYIENSLQQIFWE